MKTASALGPSLLALGLSTAGTAADLAAPEAKIHETFWNRETLTGDWGGFRRTLGDHGVSLDLQFTELYQGMFSGTGNDDFEFGSRADALIDLDSGKLRLYQGGGLHAHLSMASSSSTTSPSPPGFVSAPTCRWSTPPPATMTPRWSAACVATWSSDAGTRTAQP